MEGFNVFFINFWSIFDMNHRLDMTSLLGSIRQLYGCRAQTLEQFSKRKKEWFDRHRKKTLTRERQSIQEASQRLGVCRNGGVCILNRVLLKSIIDIHQVIRHDHNQRQILT